MPKVTDGFRYVLTPYMWMPGVSGPVYHNNTKIGDLNMSNGQVLDSLSIGAMLNGTVYYERWGIMGNATYAKLRPSGTSSYQQGVNVDTDTTFWLGIYTVAGTYTAYASDSVFLDVLAGARFLNLNVKTALKGTVAATGYSADTTVYTQYNTTNPVAGVQGRIRMGESQFFVPFYLDVSGASQNSTFNSQQILGIGYTYKNIDTLLVYNNVYYKMNKDNFSARLDMGGPAIATTFRF